MYITDFNTKSKQLVAVKSPKMKLKLWKRLKLSIIFFGESYLFEFCYNISLLPA